MLIKQNYLAQIVIIIIIVVVVINPGVKRRRRRRRIIIIIIIIIIALRLGCSVCVAHTCKWSFMGTHSRKLVR